MAAHDDDPVSAGFDRMMAYLGYGLLFASVLMAWFPAIVAVVIAIVHKRDADWVVASHFRFQIKLFWTGLVLVALSLGCLLGAGGFALGAVWDLLGREAAGETTAGATAGGLLVAGLALGTLWALGTLTASAWGAWRLARARPIGQSPARRMLESR